MKHATLARIQILLEQCEALQHGIRAAASLMGDERVSERDRLVAASEVLTAAVNMGRAQPHKLSPRTTELVRGLIDKLDLGET